MPLELEKLERLAEILPNGEFNDGVFKWKPCGTWKNHDHEDNAIAYFRQGKWYGHRALLTMHLLELMAKEGKLWGLVPDGSGWECCVYIKLVVQVFKADNPHDAALSAFLELREAG